MKIVHTSDWHAGRVWKQQLDRLPELEAVAVPVLVVQGERDPFGTPPAGPHRTVVRIPGTHSLRSAAAVAAAVSPWLTAVATGGAD